MLTLVTLSSLRRQFTPPASSSELTPASLEAQGYTRTSTASGFKLTSPVEQYQAAFYVRGRERSYSYYSPVEYEFDASGNLVRRTAYEIQPSYATSGYTLWSPRVLETQEYSADTISTTTTPFSGRVEQMSIYNPQDVQKADITAAQESRERFLRENVISVTKNYSTGTTVTSQRYPTYENVYSQVNDRAENLTFYGAPSLEQKKTITSSRAAPGSEYVAVSPALYNKYLIESQGLRVSAFEGVAYNPVTMQAVSLAREGDAAYLRTVPETNMAVGDQVRDAYINRFDTFMNEGWLPVLPGSGDYWGEVYQGARGVAGTFVRAYSKVSAGFQADFSVNWTKPVDVSLPEFYQPLGNERPSVFAEDTQVDLDVPLPRFGEGVFYEPLNIPLNREERMLDLNYYQTPFYKPFEIEGTPSKTVDAFRDKDVQAVLKGLWQVPETFILSPLRGLGKAAYIGADITLLSTAGTTGRDLVLPAFSWEEVERRKLNTDVGIDLLKPIDISGVSDIPYVQPLTINTEDISLRSDFDPFRRSGIIPREQRWLGFKNEPLPDLKGTPYELGYYKQDKDLQALLVAAGLATVAYTGGITGTFLVESAAIGYGVYTLPEALRTGNIGETSVAIASIIAGRPVKKLTRIPKELFLEKIPENMVWGEESGKSVTSKNIRDLLRQFNSGRMQSNLKSNLKLVTVGPRPIAPYLDRPGASYIRIMGGPKGKAGIEPEVLYLSYPEAANPMFSGIPGTSTYSEFSLNPFANLFNKPSVTEVRGFDFARLPRAFAKIPGFKNEAMAWFNKEVKGMGLSWVTKRAEIGQGALKRQFLTVLQDIKLRTVSYRKGQRVLEAGTSEAEVGIPAGEVLKKTYPEYNVFERFMGGKYYTTYQAKKIPFTDIEIPLTGEYVRVDQAFLMKYRPFAGNIGRGRIYDLDTQRKLEAEVVLRRQRQAGQRASSSESVTKIPIKSFSVSSFGAPTLSAAARSYSGYSLGTSTFSPSSTSFSYSVSPSYSPSVSQSLSQSRSVSESVSESVSASVSASFSRSVSESLSQSRSASRSASKSASRSMSRSTSRTGLFPPPFFPGASGRFVPVFNVYVRESAPKGKKRAKSLIKLNKRALSEDAALSLGADYVDNSSARTFLLKRAGKGPETPSVKPFNLDKFRLPKGKSRLPAGSYVEKSMFNIDTQGELQGITARGLKKLREMRGAY